MLQLEIDLRQKIEMAQITKAIPIKKQMLLIRIFSLLNYLIIPIFTLLLYVTLKIGHPAIAILGIISYYIVLLLLAVFTNKKYTKKHIDLFLNANTLEIKNSLQDRKFDLKQYNTIKSVTSNEGIKLSLCSASEEISFSSLATINDSFFALDAYIINSFGRLTWALYNVDEALAGWLNIKLIRNGSLIHIEKARQEIYSGITKSDNPIAKRSFYQQKIIAKISIAIGITMILSSAVFAFNKAETLKEFIPTKASVQNIEVIMGSKNSKSYSYDINYLTEDKIIINQKFLTAYKYQKGDNINILYDSKNPENFRHNTFFSLWFGYIWIAICGTIMALIAFLYLRGGWKR